MKDEEIREILIRYRRIAVVGISRDPNKPARKVPKFLMSRGYEIIPVNPYADEILGEKSYPSLPNIPKEKVVEIVEVFRPSEDVLPIVETAIERKRKYGDVEVIWLQEGIRNDEAKELAEKEGVKFVQDKCMYKEYVRLIEGREPELL
jgi:hypothetical protein